MEANKMKFKDWFMYVLGAIIVIGFFITLSHLITTGEYNKELGILLGALVGAFGLVVGYFYGSSKGSSDKNDMLRPKQ